MSNFRPINRNTGFLLPPSVDEWLPQRHLARFAVEVIEDELESDADVCPAGSPTGVNHTESLDSVQIWPCHNQLDPKSIFQTPA